jgi:hypothetical protein
MHLRDTLDKLEKEQPVLLQALIGTLEAAQLEKMKSVLAGSAALKESEDETLKAAEALEKSKA